MNLTRVLNFIGASPSPNADEKLFDLLDLDPQRDADREKYDDDAVHKQILKIPAVQGRDTN